MRLSHSPDWSSVTIDGTVYPLSVMQGKIVRALWQAAQRGNPCLHTATLLTMCQSSGNRIFDLFRTPTGKRFIPYIKQGPRGVYRLAFATELMPNQSVEH